MRLGISALANNGLYLARLVLTRVNNTKYLTRSISDHGYSFTLRCMHHRLQSDPRPGFIDWVETDSKVRPCYI